MFLCTFGPLVVERRLNSRCHNTIVCTNDGLEYSQNTYSTFYSARGSNSLSHLPVFYSWIIDILIDSIKQLAPGINWVNVFENLDHKGFYIPNEAEFSIFMSTFRQVCQDPFPLSAVCGSVWNNVKGQLSFLKYAVSVPPEIFSFAHFGRQLAYVDAVNVHKFQQDM